MSKHAQRVASAHIQGQIDARGNIYRPYIRGDRRVAYLEGWYSEVKKIERTWKKKIAEYPNKWKPTFRYKLRCFWCKLKTNYRRRSFVKKKSILNWFKFW